MAWLGILIGAMLGYGLGGPWGALFGALIGYSLASRRAAVSWMGGHAERARAVFFKATFSVMGHVAKADGRVSADEIRVARTVMAQMNLSPAQQRAAIELFNQGKQPNFPLDAVLIEFRNECRGYAGLLRMFLQIQLQAALADGALDPAEQEIFNRICGVLDVPLAQMHQFAEFIRAQQGFGADTASFRSRPDPLATAYQTLGVSPQADEDAIKRAYRRLMKENHPDRLVARGLPEAMLNLAQEKAKQINVAYEAVKAARGMK